MPLLSTDDVPAEHMRELPQGPLGPPAPRGPRVEPRGARAGRNRARRVAQAVPGGEARPAHPSFEFFFGSNGVELYKRGWR